MSYNEIFSNMSIGDSLYYLSVPKYAIDYIEIPSINLIHRLGEDEMFDIDGELFDLYDINMQFEADSCLIYLFDTNKDKLVKQFVTYYNEYLLNLKEELEFLSAAIPNITKTPLVKSIVESSPEIWV